MEYILKSIKKDRIRAKPAIVISNNVNAKGLEIANKLGIKTEVIDSKGVKGGSWEYDKKII